MCLLPTTARPGKNTWGNDSWCVALLSGVLNVLYMSGNQGIVMINASEALQVILEYTPHLGTEKVGLLESLGRTVGKDLIADVDLPPFDNSSMDGYAVSSVDLVATTKEVILRLAGEASAGNPFRETLRQGTTVR